MCGRCHLCCVAERMTAELNEELNEVKVSIAASCCIHAGMPYFMQNLDVDSALVLFEA